MMWPYNAISTEVPLIINETIHIDTFHSLICQYPKESTDAAGMFAHHFPIVVQSGTVTTIVQTMEEFCRHEDFRQTHVILTFTVRTIVHGFKTGKITLRVNHRTFLRVVFMKFPIEFGIPSFFITVAPPNNRRMVNIPLYHSFNQSYSGRGIIFAMPAT